MRIILGAVAFAILNLCAICIEAFAQTPRGPSGAVFLNAAACVSRGGRSKELCANAEKNAAAEFEEKAPRFATRAACEAALHGPCAIGFGRIGASTDQKRGVYFTPRSDGFRIVETYGRDPTVAPVAGSLSFQPRPVNRLAVSISPEAAKYWDWGSRAAASPADVGVSSPDSTKGEIPPPPPVDPNFDCAVVLEPSARASAATACAPAPPRKR
jgi:hypothetical protein